MTFEIIEHDGSTLNLVLKNGKNRVEILVYKNGDILDCIQGNDTVNKNELNVYYALKMLQQSPK